MSPWEDVCRVLRHNLQLLAQHFHGVALMLIRAGNRGGNTLPVNLVPWEAPTLSFPLHCRVGLLCLFICAPSLREMWSLPRVRLTGTASRLLSLSPFSVYCKGCRNKCGRYFRRQTVWLEVGPVVAVKWATLVVHLPTEMEAAVSAPAKPHPVPAGSDAYIWTDLIPQHHRALER